MNNMVLPSYVKTCMDALEEAGFAAYAVGGCVRDACLGLIPSDYDLCTSALPEQTETVFADRKLVLAGEKHGTVGVVTEGGVVEITTFRTEGGYEDNRHPQWVRFVPDIEADLARRDFTVNAMAWSPKRGLADPFGGREDLEKRILRAVGDPEARFREDSLRILRGARFAVKYHLEPAQDTKEAMFSLAGLMDNLARERVFEELCKLIILADGDDLIAFAPVICAAVPELAPMVGFDQRTPYHAYDIYTHTAQAVARTPRELSLRWAALLHDVGKVACFTQDEQGQGHFYGHPKVGAEMADRILQRLKAPSSLREEVVFLVKNHMLDVEDDPKLLRRRMSQYGPERYQRLVQLQWADFCAKGVHTDHPRDFARILEMIREISREHPCLCVKDLAVNGHDMLALGYKGPEIGEKLNRLLTMVLDEQISNDRETLLGVAAEL